MTITSKILAASALALVGVFAYLSLFGFLSVYDDEGYNVAMIRLVAQGVPLYTGQYAYHGPLPYLIKALALNAMGIAVNHQSVRLWVLAMWLMSAVALAIAIRNLTRNSVFAIGSLVVVGAHMFPLRFNPGHPEDFVVLLLAVSVLVASTEASWLTENMRVATLGLIAAALLGTKINVGILYLLGLAAWLLASLPRGKLWRTLSVLFVAGSTAAPAVLMHGWWRPEWQLLVVSTLVIFLAGYAWLLRPVPARYAWRHVAICAASAALGVTAIVLLAMLRGSRPLDILDGTILTAAKHPSVFLRPVSFGIVTIPVMAALGLISLWQFIRISRDPEIEHRAPQAVLKVALALSAFLLVAMADSRLYFPLIGPIGWLVVFPGAASKLTDRSRSARLFLVLIAAFQVLQAFPIIGTQTAWSSLLLCACSLVLLHDGMLELSERSEGVRRFARLSVALAGGLALYSLAFFMLGMWNSYRRTPSLGFSNSSLIRVPLAVRADFDWITASTDRYCDVLVTQPGMNSLLVWSKSAADMRTSPVLISGWPLILTDDEERHTIARVSQASRICAVYNKRASEWWTNDGPQLTPASLARQPLVAYIQHLHAIRKVGDYEVRANAAVASDWKDDYLLNGTRDLNGARAAVGVPGDLITSAADVELAFGFQASRAGPVLSVPQTDASAGEAPPMEPILYLSPDGGLMIRSKPGTYVRLAGQAGVLDGLWHEVSLRRDAAGWEVSLDEISTGRIGELLTGGKPAQYLQLGPAFVEKGTALGPGWIPFAGKLRDVRVKRASADSGTRLVSCNGVCGDSLGGRSIGREPGR